MIKIFNEVMWKNNNFGYKWGKFCDRQYKRVYIQNHTFWPIVDDKKTKYWFIWKIYNWFELQLFTFLNGFSGHDWFEIDLKRLLKIYL